MAKKKIVTNAMRILTKANIDFQTIEYDDVATDTDHLGLIISEKTGIPPERSFKTLTLKGEKCGIIVCCIPVDCELDLKKLASCVGEKKVEMIHVKDILNLTGYIRGGVSPIGMKKQYKTYIDKTCELFENIAISGGTCGCTLDMKTKDLISITSAKVYDITREEKLI